MDKKMCAVVLAAVMLVMLCACACLVCYFCRRERRFAGRIQRMLDDAVAGKFQERNLDESRLSVIENTMWRYLCSHEVAVRRLAAQQEQMQAQISDISHQAVIPISNIILYAQLLEEWAEGQELEEKQDIKEQLSTIREQAGVLDFLVASLTKLSRLETGIIHVNSRRQPLQPVLEGIRKQFQAVAEQKEIQLTVPDTEEEASFDRKWTVEAVANIVDNAMKYTPYGGRVTVRVLPYASFVRVDVEDNGIGIPEEEQANVFSRFYRSEMVSDKPGVGIGLYLAREVMEAQNGYIKLSSKPGEGSVFSLFFLKEISQK